VSTDRCEPETGRPKSSAWAAGRAGPVEDSSDELFEGRVEVGSPVTVGLGGQRLGGFLELVDLIGQAPAAQLGDGGPSVAGLSFDGTARSGFTLPAAPTEFPVPPTAPLVPPAAPPPLRDRQPLVLASAVQSLVPAVVDVLSAFGIWWPTEEQMAAVVGLWMTISAIATAWAHSKVFAPSTVTQLLGRRPGPMSPRWTLELYALVSVGATGDLIAAMSVPGSPPAQRTQTYHL
jgi:hypothetical protein